MPAYAAYPNLAWQDFSYSDTSNHFRTAYHADGRQGDLVGILDGVAAEMREFPALREVPELVAAVAQERAERREATPPFFRGPRRHRFEETFPFSFYINLDRRPDRRAETEAQFERHDLALHRQAAVDARLVTNSRSYAKTGPFCCALSHRLALRRARKAGVDAVALFEDDVVLHPDFRALVEALEIPDDWGVFLFGCWHREPPEIVGCGIVRVRKFFGTQSFAVGKRWIPRVLRTFASGGRSAEPGSIKACDEALSDLAAEIPTYAAFPNLAWQGAGHSDLLHRQRRGFDEDGRPLIHLHPMDDTEEEMRAMIAQSLLAEGEPPTLRG